MSTKMQVRTRLSFTETAYLAAVVDGMTITELARAVGRDVSATSRAVQSLAMKGVLSVRAGQRADETAIYRVAPVAPPTIEAYPRVPVTVSPNTYARRHGDTDAVLLTFTCPWCREVHSHGSGSGRLLTDGTYGYRTSHCLKFDGQYILVPA